MGQTPYLSVCPRWAEGAVEVKLLRSSTSRKDAIDLLYL